MMREFTGNKELVRYSVTRFVTSFLTLQSVHRLKHNLRNMFASEKWVTTKWAKEIKDKRATDIILMPSFWNHVVYILKVIGPLVQVIRLVDNENKPTMKYIYEAMDKANEIIKRSFNKNEEKYEKNFTIIDEKWNCQLHCPLHAAGYYLNPEFFYMIKSVGFDAKVLDCLYQCVVRLVPSLEVQDKIIYELSLYKNDEVLFGIPMIVRSRTTTSPSINNLR
ncbi:unnamed protein product [Musa textilis]